MRIAVIGSGGVGGYFGGRLAAAGTEVTFVARGPHLMAMKQRGLKVLSALGDLHLKDVRCTDDPSSIGPVDVVMIAVKLWSTGEAARSAKALLGPETAVVSFQNGVVAVDTLIPVVGREHVMGGVANIAALIEEPGVIRHNGYMANLFFGELDGRRSARAEALLAACRKANISADIVPDIQLAIWEKFVRLVTMSAVTTLMRLPIGPIREDPDTRALLIQVMKEVVAVGQAKGIRFPVNIVEDQLSKIDSYPPGMVASMCGDLRRGNRLELPWLSGTVAKLGAELGTPTPANQFVHAALKLHADGRHPLAQI
ncbi:MAG TPA: 2-dehydropantoate 2-reductase [Burkholderiales bacterium]|jgi:2-dehydropantoate 2-reductase|nr:2-dehydropantoate 2-reductase [Burkholderiales bacterium]